MRIMSPSFFAIVMVPGIVLAIVISLVAIRSGEAGVQDIGAGATAVLESPDGGPMGTVKMTQWAAGVLVAVDAQGLAPGGHAFIVHAVGACTPDFAAAGDHFNPQETEHGFIHPNWKRDEHAAGHGGDLPNIYAGLDGSARADFFTDGITLEVGPDHSVFDSDGSAIIVHEKPDAYGEEESDTGDRVACGVIRPN